MKQGQAPSLSAELLTLDWGNSRCKWALFRQDQLLEHGVEQPGNFDLEQIFGSKVPSTLLVCFTGNKKQWPPQIHLNMAAYELRAGEKLPFASKYSTPKTLGADRIALVQGAISAYPGKRVLIIDAGTCITMDLVSAGGEHLGGSIHPGLHMRLRAMHEFTAGLPLPEYTRDDIPSLISLNTRDNLLSGALRGGLREIEGFALDYLELDPDTHVLITGGDGPYLDKHLKIRKFADPFLLHKGLNALYKIHNSGGYLLPALVH